MASFRRNLLRLILLSVAVFFVAWLLRVTDTRHLMRLTLEKIQSLGPLAPLCFIVAYISACLVFFPGVILTLGGGILFGVALGTLYSAIGATLGAAAAFLISRYMAREWVQGKFGRNRRFRAIDDAVAEDGWKIVGLIRLSPVFPYIPLNYLFGLTRIPFVQFVVVTFLALIPNTALFTYAGLLVGDLAELGSRPIASGRTKWLVMTAGIVSTVVVTFFVTRIARRSLAKRLPEEINEESGDCAASG